MKRRRGRLGQFGQAATTLAPPPVSAGPQRRASRLKALIAADRRGEKQCGKPLKTVSLAERAPSQMRKLRKKRSEPSLPRIALAETDHNS